MGPPASTLGIAEFVAETPSALYASKKKNIRNLHRRMLADEGNAQRRASALTQEHTSEMAEKYMYFVDRPGIEDLQLHAMIQVRLSAGLRWGE